MTVTEWTPENLKCWQRHLDAYAIVVFIAHTLARGKELPADAVNSAYEENQAAQDDFLSRIVFKETEQKSSEVVE